MNAPMTPIEPMPTWSEEDCARADHYALLARLFHSAPDAALLRALIGSSRALGAGDGAFPAAWAALGEAAAHTDAARAADEYAALFLGVGRAEVMINASWYLAGFLQETPLAELRDDLAELGLGRRAGVAETEDHLSALAEVMRHLVLTGPDEAGLARQRHFFTRHLAPWYGRFVDAVEAQPAADFYAKAGALLRAFFDIERDAFDML